MQNNFRFCRQQQLISNLRYEYLDVANFPKLQICLEKLQKKQNFASKFLWTIANLSYLVMVSMLWNRDERRKVNDNQNGELIL